MDRSQHSRPLWVGVLACIAAAPVMMSLLMAVSAERVIVPPILVLIVGLLIAAPATLFVALPLALALRRAGKLSSLYLCLAGALVGAAALGLFALHDNYWPQMTDQSFARWVALQAALKAMLPGSMYGFVSAVAFSIGAGLSLRPIDRVRGAA
jgi:hypothetical protein